MEKGKKVKIKNGTFFDGKEGIIENIDGDKITVYVDFNKEENKKIRQDFNAEELEEVLSESLDEEKLGLYENAFKDISLDLSLYNGIEEFTLESGRKPIFENFDEIKDEKLRSKILKDLMRLSLLRRDLKPPYCKYLNEKIIELRTEQGGNINRIFYIFDGDKIILLNGYMKKQQKLDRREFDTALKYKKSYFKRKGNVNEPK